MNSNYQVTYIDADEATNSNRKRVDQLKSVELEYKCRYCDSENTARVRSPLDNTYLYEFKCTSCSEVTTFETNGDDFETSLQKNEQARRARNLGEKNKHTSIYEDYQWMKIKERFLYMLGPISIMLLGIILRLTVLSNTDYLILGMSLGAVFLFVLSSIYVSRTEVSRMQDRFKKYGLSREDVERIHNNKKIFLDQIRTDDGNLIRDRFLN